MKSWGIGPSLPRRATLGWYIIFGPALFALAVWRSLWWQWLLPAEDLTLDGFVWLGCTAGLVLGLVTARSGWNWRVYGALIGTIGPALVFTVLAFPLPILFLPGAITYWLSRRLARNDPAWRPSLAIALVPLLIASLFATPPFDSFKWLWPWAPFRGRILRFQAASDASADRLGLPVGRRLTKEELDAWSAATPLRLRLQYPVLGTQVTVSVVNPWTDQRFPDGFVWAWWGGPGRPTFGALDVRTMRILSSSD
jgi:hypothetical protein